MLFRSVMVRCRRRGRRTRVRRCAAPRRRTKRDAIDQQQEIEGRAHGGRSIRRETDAIAHALACDAHDLRRLQCLANGGAVDAEPPGQITSWRVPSVIIYLKPATSVVVRWRLVLDWYVTEAH